MGINSQRRFPPPATHSPYCIFSLCGQSDCTPSMLLLIAFLTSSYPPLTRTLLLPKSPHSSKAVRYARALAPEGGRAVQHTSAKRKVCVGRNCRVSVKLPLSGTPLLPLSRVTLAWGRM